MNTLWLPLLLSSVIWAEEDYFHISPNATWDDYIFPEQNTTWDEARDHCQKCFKELTTITSRNVHLIVQQNVSLDYWIGLRKSYNGTIPWSRWSNEDPVTYQNWYPGHPVPNKEQEIIPRCFSTTETPLSTLITDPTSTPMSTPTSTPVTSTQTSTVTTLLTSLETSPETSPPNTTDEMCPILIEILDCLNKTYDELEDEVHKYMTTKPQDVTPKTTTYSSTPYATTFTTIFSTPTESPTTESPTTESITTESTTNSNCVFEPDPNLEVYLEDACVVLLSFGMWKEINCTKSRPFICYDVRFFGQIYITNVTSRTGNLSWSEAPGNITHYRVEITGTNQTNQTFNISKTDLYKEIENLTPGNLYNVQVIPVKCGRDLNPQNISFYTIPSAVEKLTVVSVTTESITLTWSKPAGDCEFYLVSVKNVSDSTKMKKECKSEECTITGLTPGREYEFIVTATVNKSIYGVPNNVSDYTMPSKVTNLTSKDDDSTVITAYWNASFGGHTSYRYCLKMVNNTDMCTDCSFTTNCITTEICSNATNSNNTTNCSNATNCNNATNSSNATNCNNATNSSNAINCNIIKNCSFITDCNITQTASIRKENKTDGSKYCLCVGALTKDDSLSGEMVVISAYTRPKNVSLVLSPGYQTMTASWTIQGNYEKFNVMIETAADNKILENTTTASLDYTFQNLKAGVNYSVTVVTLNGNLRSYNSTNSSYTKPTPPGPATATSNKTNITVTWEVPDKSKNASILYMVEYCAPFWNINRTITTEDTKYTFSDLKSGTKYKFNVSVLAGKDKSDPVVAEADTEPNKRTLILTMLCSSQTELQCESPETQTDAFNKLNKTFGKELDNVHWKMRWVERK